MSPKKLLSRIGRCERALEALQAELKGLREELEASGETLDAPRGSLLAQIEELLRSAPRRSWSSAEIAEALHLDETRIRSLRSSLARLVREKRIASPHRGLYKKK